MTGERGRFRLASDTKAFTATAVLRLVADGRLGLGDRAGSYVPQLADSPLTVRQLLKQTSGLPEYSALVDWTGRGRPRSTWPWRSTRSPSSSPARTGATPTPTTWSSAW